MQVGEPSPPTPTHRTEPAAAQVHQSAGGPERRSAGRVIRYRRRDTSHYWDGSDRLEIPQKPGRSNKDSGAAHQMSQWASRPRMNGQLAVSWKRGKCGRCVRGTVTDRVTYSGTLTVERYSLSRRLAHIKSQTKRYSTTKSITDIMSANSQQHNRRQMLNTAPLYNIKPVA